MNQPLRPVKTILVVCLFILIVVVLFWQFIFLGKIPIPSDLLLGAYYPWLGQSWHGISLYPIKNPMMPDVVSQLYPWRLLVIQYFQHGQFPLWDPTIVLGKSLIGNFQAGIFNPFNLLFIIPLKFQFIWGMQVILQPLIGMLTMYLLLRNWKLPYLAAIFGAISYGLSGPLLIWMSYNVHSFIIATFPLLIYLIDKYLVQQKIIYMVGLSLVVTTCFFYGYPQFVYYALATGFFYIICQTIKDKRKLLVLSSVYILFVILGLGVSAVQLLPGAESVYLSIRNFEQININLALPLEHLLTAIYPDFFGNPATFNYWGKGSYESFGFYTSIVCLMAAVWAYSRKTKYLNLLPFLTITIIGAVLFTLKPFSEVFQNFTFLGLKGSFPTRVLYIYSFALSGLGSVGIANLLAIDCNKKYLKVILFCLITIVLFVSLTVIYYLLNLSYFTNHPVQFQISLRNMYLPLSLMFATLGILILTWFTNRKLFLVGLVLLLLFDMYRFSWKYLPFIDADLVFPVTPSLQYLQDIVGDNRIAIEKSELLTSNTWSPYGLESVSGYDVLVPRRSSIYNNALNGNPMASLYSRFVGINDFSSPLFHLTSTKYIVSLKRINGVPSASGYLPHQLNNLYPEVYQDGPVTILKNELAVPRVYSVEKVYLKQNESDQLELLTNPEFRIGHDVVLDQEVGLIQICQTDYSRPSTQNYLITVNCPTDGLIIVSDNYDSGWKAHVNEVSLPVLKVNYNFIGIKVPAGQSVIKLDYLPDSFIIGAGVSLVSLFLLIFISIASHLKYKKITMD